jgi:hypothetical protein
MGPAETVRTGVAALMESARITALGSYAPSRGTAASGQLATRKILREFSAPSSSRCPSIDRANGGGSRWSVFAGSVADSCAEADAFVLPGTSVLNFSRRISTNMQR